MILPDVNVLLYSFRRDSIRHSEYKAWLEGVMNGPDAYGVAPQVLASLVRISTNPRAYSSPSTSREALAFCDALMAPPQATIVQPGDRHWGIYRSLCDGPDITGNLTQDAWFAALAIEHGCEWMTDDDDYARFPGLRWRRPLHKTP